MKEVGQLVLIELATARAPVLIVRHGLIHSRHCRGCSHCTRLNCSSSWQMFQTSSISLPQKDLKMKTVAPPETTNLTMAGLLLLWMSFR